MSALEPQTVLFGTLVYGDEPLPTDDPAELFHEASRFYPDVVDTLAVGGALLAHSPELQASASRAVRRRTGLPATRLPEPEPAAESLDALVAARRSTRAYADTPVPLAQLSTLLHASYGVTGALGTAGIWATYPQPWLSTVGGLIDQIVGTAVLIMVIFALGDAKNVAPQSNLGPVVVGFLMMVIGMAYGLNAGYAINPARDFAPRLFTAIAGWGGEVFTAGNGWWWVPIVGPAAGAVAGGWLYDACVGNRFPAARATVST